MLQAMSAPLLLTSRIVRATLFSDSAHVVRAAHTPLTAGSHRVALNDLPRHLDPSRLRIKTSHGEVRFVESDDLSWRDADGDGSEASSRTKQAQQDVWRLQGQLEAMQQELHLIDRVLPGRGHTGPTGPLRPASFFEGLEALTQRRQQTLEAIQATQTQLHQAEDQLRRAAEVQQAQGRTEVQGDQSLLVVGLEASEDGEAELELTYTSGWATWRPYYALRLSEGGTKVEVARYADVWQQTQEDWDQVQLALSTAEPEDSLLVPSVQPWILSASRGFDANARGLYANSAPAKKRPKPAPARGAPMASAPPPPAPRMADMPAPQEVVDELDTYAQQFEEEGIFAEVTSTAFAASQVGGAAPGGAPPQGSMAALPPPPPVPPAIAGTQRHPSADHPDLYRLQSEAAPREAAGGIDFEQSVPGYHECNSGLGHQRFALGQRSYAADVKYLLRPALKDHAYAQVSLTHAEQEPLLAGPAAIFVDDAYYGSSRLKTTPAGGTMQLDLGAETSIKSARRTRTTVRTEGLISKEDVHAVQITIEIENFLDRTAQVEIQDQIPVSTDSRVQVKLLQTSPEATLDKDNGILSFQRSIPPGAHIQLLIHYEIEAPRDYHIVQSLAEAS